MHVVAGTRACPRVLIPFIIILTDYRDKIKSKLKIKYGVLYMKRLTKESDSDSGAFVVHADLIEKCADGYGGKAIDKLAVFENVLDGLAEEQGKIAERLEALRSEGKTNSVKFKELLGQKLLNANTLALFEVHGIRG